MFRLGRRESVAVRAPHSHDGSPDLVFLLLFCRASLGRPRRPCSIIAFPWRQHRSGINWCGGDRAGRRNGTGKVSWLRLFNGLCWSNSPRTGTRGWTWTRNITWHRLDPANSCSHPVRTGTWGRTSERSWQVCSCVPTDARQRLLWSIQSVDGRNHADEFHPDIRVLRSHGA